MTSRTIKRIDVRNSIYTLLGQMSTIDIVKHFQKENIPRSTIYSIIKCLHNGLPVEDKSRKGLPAKLSKKQQQILKDCVESHVDVSQRKMAAKFKVSRSCIRRN